MFCGDKQACKVSLNIETLSRMPKSWYTTTMGHIYRVVHAEGAKNQKNFKNNINFHDISRSETTYFAHFDLDL